MCCTRKIVFTKFYLSYKRKMLLIIVYITISLYCVLINSFLFSILEKPDCTIWLLEPMPLQDCIITHIHYSHCDTHSEVTQYLHNISWLSERNLNHPRRQHSLSLNISLLRKRIFLEIR